MSYLVGNPEDWFSHSLTDINHFFLFSFTSLSRLFQLISSETGQSVGGAKIEIPEKNHLAHPQAELVLSHM